MTKIAIASCCKIQMQRDQPAWAEIESEQPDLLLLLGDNAYMLNNKWDHDYLDARYKEQFKEKNFASLIKKVPFLATWDDHDCGVNDSRGGEIADWKRRKSRALFHKYMGGAVAKNRPEVYASYELDDIKIIMLDVRYYRERISRRKPNATLLGAKQEAWLWKELDHSKRYTVIGSGSCIKDGADRETWMDFKQFYKEFRARIADVKRILFVSGDIHRNKFNDHQGFFEAISSGIGRKEKHGKWPNQRTGKPLDNYGIIDFRSNAVTVSLRGRRRKDRIEREIRSSTWTLAD